MGRWFWIHAKADCEFCVEAIKYLNKLEFQYVLSFYDRSPYVLEVFKKKWNHDTVPIIIEYKQVGEPTLIGGYDDLVEYLTDLGYTVENKEQT